MRQFLVWIPRRRTAATASARDAEPLAERAARPIGYATRQPHMHRLLRPGDRLWFVGSDRKFGLAQPSLDAELVVGSLILDSGALKVRAGDGSRWLAWNNATGLLMGLRFSGRSGTLALSSARPFGVQLRTNRLLDEASAMATEHYADALDYRPGLFISYKWRDAGRLVGPVVAAAAAAGFAPWWDRWSAPRRLSRELEPTPDGDLSAFLRHAIDGSKAALVLSTPHYGTGGTAIEIAAIRQRGMPVLMIGPEQMASPQHLARQFMEFRRRV
ncbi:hypothetical protein [Emcibacter sp. SYSU 3D8]|uniref:hypothetical protein n=1 Tax=Emcibacter sp. SYSU 3D8 TaxID=3133969 RepID=UPI0031FF28F8